MNTNWEGPQAKDAKDLKDRRDINDLNHQKANENAKIKPSHLRYAIDDLRAGGAGQGRGRFGGACAGGVAAGRGLRAAVADADERRSGQPHIRGNLIESDRIRPNPTCPPSPSRTARKVEIKVN